MAQRAANGRAQIQWRVHHELPNRTRFRLASPPPRLTTPAAVERAIEALPGVRRARFTVETGSLLVEHDGGDVTRRELRRALELLRFEDAPHVNGKRREGSTQPGVVKTAVLSLLAAALPPAPRAALELVRSLHAAARQRELT